jgi:hypothetical protein
VTSRSPPFRVAADRRHLERADGSTFLWLGDTAWELLHRLNRADTEHYLESRARQGFTVIQAVVLAEIDGLRTPNANGDLPFHVLDPQRPNEAYFAHVDWVLERARVHGLTVALLPTWGDKLQRWWGVGPEVFSPTHQGLEAAMRLAFGYARFLARRYREADNLVWVLGGDRSSHGHTLYPLEGGETCARVWRAMADGLRDGDGGRHLVGFHPSGGQSSRQETLLEDTLDFHAIQSGHGHSDTPNWVLLRRDLELQPTKPVLDAEPCYEDIPIAFDPARGYFDAGAVRRAAYAAFFSGACGHTYGANAVWQMYTPDVEAQLHARQPWREALNLPFAASQLRVLRDFLEVTGWSAYRFDPEMIPVPLEGHRRILSMRSANGVLVYLPFAQTHLEVRLGDLEAVRFSGAWFDPRTGARHDLGRLENNALQRFAPPSLEEDWVLKLEVAG